jgi:hypothetical protein
VQESECVCCVLGFTHMHINSGPISSSLGVLCVLVLLGLGADTGAGRFFPRGARETNGAPSSVAAGGARMQLMLLRNKKQMWPELKTSLCHPHPPE